MQRSAPPHHRAFEKQARQQPRSFVWASVLMTLALGACSGLSPREDIAKRPPSIGVAKAALDAGAPELALRVAELELAKNPNDVSALVARGDALYAMGRREQARSAYRAAIKLAPETTAAQVGLGRTLAQSDPAAAEAAFLVALAHEPDNVIALNNLGVVRDLQGRHADAQEAYAHAISVAPLSTDVQINLGMSLALAGRTSEATRLLHDIASDPEARQAWRQELVNALTLAGDGAWAQHELPAGPILPMQGTTLVADNPGPSPSPAAQLASAAPATKGSDNEPSVPATPASELRQPLAIKTDPRAAVAASELAPAAPRPRDRSRAEPPDPGPERVHGVSDRAKSAIVAVEAIAGPVDRLDQYATASVPRSDAAASPHPASVDGDFYVQLASLTSETGAFSEWGRLSHRLPQLLAGRDPTVTAAEAHGRTYWRLRAFGFASPLEAKEMCHQLEQNSLHCWTGRGL